MLTEAAPAKINLTLHVVGRRPDGYHLLDSLVVFAGAHDLLTATASDDLSLRVTGRFAAGLPSGSDNLVLRAARCLADHVGMRAGAALVLDKVLPVASGIGGGSSDAAAALRLLTRLWQLDLGAPAMHALAAWLGADVPVCLDRVACRMTGIGDVLSTPPAVPSCGIVLVNPGEALATQAVFRARSGGFSTPPVLPAAWNDAGALAASVVAGTNDLQDAATALCPAIGTVLAVLGSLPGCLVSRMSGSGATCFALFATAAEAAAAASAIVRPGWWVWGGPLWTGEP